MKSTTFSKLVRSFVVTVFLLSSVGLAQTTPPFNPNPAADPTSAPDGSDAETDAQPEVPDIGDLIPEQGDDDLFGDIDGVLEDAGDIWETYGQPVFGIGKDLKGLFDNFSVNGLFDFACKTARNVDEIEEGVEEDSGVPEEERYQNRPSEEADSICRVADTMERWKQIMEESQGSIFTTADQLFGEFMALGIVDIPRGEQEEVSGLLKAFENLRQEVSGDINVMDLYEAGKELLDTSKEIALNDTTGEPENDPAFGLAKRLRIDREYKLKEQGVKSIVTQAAAEELAQTSREFAAEGAQVNAESVDLSYDRQIDAQSAVSTRATLQVAVDSLTDLLRQSAATDTQTLNELTILSQTTVMTAKELATQTQIMLREQEDELRLAQAADYLETQEIEREIASLEQIAGGIGRIFEMAADPYKTAQASAEGGE